MDAGRTDEQPVFRVPVGTAANPLLGADEVGRLARSGRLVEAQAGEYLFRAGDVDPDFFVIEGGSVDVIQEATADSPERTVSSWHAGEFLGELGMLTGQRSLLSARVAETSRVRRIPHAAFRRMMAADGRLSDTLLAAFRARRRLLMNTADTTIQIIGTDGSAGAMALRRYAARMELPHRWLEASSRAGRAALAACGVEGTGGLPVVITRRGVQREATPARLAQALGLSFHPRSDGPDRFDLVVIGAGPAGLAAGIYGASEGLATLVLDGLVPGGQAASSSRIENYLGFPAGVSGARLTELAIVQALKFGVQLSAPTEVVGLETDGAAVRIRLRGDETVEARAVIVAAGARYRRLPLDRWVEFEGGSIFFAATELEARSCDRRPAVVVGGANSAGQAALFLADQGSPVGLIVRGPRIEAGMSSYLVERVLAHPRITVRTSSEVTALFGGDSLDGVAVTTAGGAPERMAAAGLFCFIGATPQAGWLEGAQRDDDGFLRTDVDVDVDGAAISADAAWHRAGRAPLPFETSLPRVFAAGDIRHGSMKRVAAAVGEGASAVASVHRALGPT